MVCPKCGTSNPEGSRFCQSCGSSLSIEVHPVNEVPVEIPDEPVPENPVVPPVQFGLQTPEQPVQALNSEEPVQNYNPVQEVQPTKSNNNRKNNKKIILIIVGILVVAAILFIVIKVIGGKANESSISINEPIKIEKDGKFGYINQNGKELVEPKFLEISEYHGNYAIATVSIDEHKYKKVVLIDKKGEIKTDEYSEYSVHYLPSSGNWLIDRSLYDKSLKRITGENINVDYSYSNEKFLDWRNYEKGEGGIITSAGKVTYTYKFKGKERFISVSPARVEDGLKETYCVVNIENEKYAIVNCDTGKLVYDFTENYIFEKKNNVFHISKKIGDYKSEFISMIYVQNNKVIFESTNEETEIEYNQSQGYIYIEDADKPYGSNVSYISLSTGEMTTEKPKKTDVEDFDIDNLDNLNPYKKFSCDSGKGLKQGDTIKIPCEWDNIEFLDSDLYEYLKSLGKDYVLAEKDSKTYVINVKNGKTITEFNTTGLLSFDDSTFISYTDTKTNEKVIYNFVTNKAMNVKRTSKINMYQGYITIEEDGKLNYYNLDLKLIYTN